MRYPFQSTGRPISDQKRVTVSSLHDTGVKFLPWYNNQGKLMLG